MQVRVIGESAAKFCGPYLQAPNMRYRMNLGDTLVAGISSTMQVRVIGESAAKLLWPVNPNIKRALLAEVWRRFCGPKFQIPKVICVIGAWPEI